MLGVKELRDYFRKPTAGGFWMDHVKRYSKSRRKAPIYWLLQSSKKSYALWLYYHRLDKDILYKALLSYVEPKMRLEESNLDQLRRQHEAVGTAGREAKQVEKQLEKQESLLSELHDFHDKLKRAADLRLEAGSQRRCGPQHRPTLGTRSLDRGEEILERAVGGQVRLVLDQQATPRTG